MQATPPSPKHTTMGSFFTQTNGNEHHAPGLKPVHTTKRCACSARRHLPLANVRIITCTGQQIPLKVVVADEIATPLQIPLRKLINDMSHRKNFTLAHPITAQGNFRISLLVGADYYWDIVEDEVIRG